MSQVQTSHAQDLLDNAKKIARNCNGSEYNRGSLGCSTTTHYGPAGSVGPHISEHLENAAADARLAAELLTQEALRCLDWAKV
jgi:hypothetical protein